MNSNRETNMANEKILYEYSESIKKIKKQCLEAGMNEDEFRKIYLESLDSIDEHDSQPQPVTNNSRNTRSSIVIILLLVLVIVCTIYNFKMIYSCLVCKLQDYVFPGLRLLRRVSIPFVSLFPSLTDLYHESCIIQNPFFTVVDMDCWPCSTVNNIHEIHNPKPIYQQHSAPFTYKTSQQVVDLEALRDLFTKHKDSFEKESTKVLVNNKISIDPEEMFQWTKDRQDSNVYVWRFNNMNTAWVLRQIISRPKVVPKFGQSTERFLIIDSSQGPFPVPDTECNFSFLLSLSGSRTIHLMPAEECKTQCKSLKIELRETFLLWYNWWYWRPVIEPSTGNATIIAHVGSYC